MPVPEQEVGEEAGCAEDQNAGQRQEHQRRKEAGDVQPVLRLDQAEGEAGVLARRAGGELGDDGGDQRQSAGDPEAREEIGERVREPQMDQRLPAVRAVKLEEIEEVVVGRVEALRGVGEDGEEGDDPGADQERLAGRRRVDQDQRRDGDDRRHLQDHGIGEERELDPARLRHQDRKRDAGDKGDRKRQEGGAQRHEERLAEDRPVGDERLADPDRAWQDVVRHVGDRDVDLPDHDEKHEHRDRYR